MGKVRVSITQVEMWRVSSMRTLLRSERHEDEFMISCYVSCGSQYSTSKTCNTLKSGTGDDQVSGLRGCTEIGIARRKRADRGDCGDKAEAINET